MAGNLFLAGICSGDGTLCGRANEMVDAMADRVVRYGTSFGNWALQLQRNVVGLRAVVCTGAFAQEQGLELARKVGAHAYIITSGKEISDPAILNGKYFGDKTHIFVCSQHSCLPSVGNVEQAVIQIGKVF